MVEKKRMKRSCFGTKEVNLETPNPICRRCDDLKKCKVKREKEKYGRWT